MSTISPNASSWRSRRCGPTSSSAPRSSRQPRAYGTPGKEGAREEAAAPAERVERDAAASAKRSQPGWKRYVSISSEPTPAASIASTMRCAPVEVGGERLLEQHGFPGLGRARIARSGCAIGPTAIATASLAAINASTSA